MNDCVWGDRTPESGSLQVFSRSPHEVCHVEYHESHKDEYYVSYHVYIVFYQEPQVCYEYGTRGTNLFDV